MLSWRVYRDGPAPGPVNMARDHALADMVQPGTAALRLYGWTRPTLSFGRNEPAGARRVDALDHVRRPTGGRAVLHDRELTYAVVVPYRALGGPRTVYRTINEALVLGLRALGADASISERGRVLPPGAGPCFRVAAPGEVVVGSRKLVGSAQARLGEALLQHGSILLAGDQERMPGPREQDRTGTDTGSTTLEAQIGPVDVCDVRVAVEDAFRRVLGGKWGPGEWDDAGARRIAALQTRRYGQDAWTWRR